MSDQFVFYEDNKDEFKMWQGLKGPYYTPYVDEDGNLSWTNNGGLTNPATVNIKGVPGTGLEIKGIVETVSALPATAASGDVYLVGSEPPYDGYLFADGGWTYIGVVGVGENGRGIASITKASTVGLVDTYTITYTDGINPTTFTVTNGADGAPGVGVPTGGTAGQVLAKASGTDYDTEWVNQSAGVDPATATPLMDGTGAVGSSAKYAREDHVHPVYDQLVRPNLLDNWYFVGGGSQLGDGIFPINSRGQTTYSGIGYTIDRLYAENSGCTTTLASTGLTLTATESGCVWIEKYMQAEALDILGKTITLSALLSDGTLGSTTGKITSTSGTVGLGEFRLNNVGFNVNLFWGSSSFQFLRITFHTATSITIAAVKLEIGDTQTLAHQENGTWVLNEIPNYEEQLLRCQTSTANSDDKYANQDVMTNYMVTNPNLLDNWYFVGGGSQQGGSQFPINQRGQTSYSGQSYGIDRWYGGNANLSVTVNQNNVTIANSDASNSRIYEQRIPKLYDGKTVTLTALLSDGTLVTGSGTFPATIGTYLTVTFGNHRMRAETKSSYSVFAFWIYKNSSISLVAVKLELGSTQTLAHQENGTWVLNEIPDYSEQLYRCCASTVDTGDTYANNPYFVPSVEILPLDDSLVSASTATIARYGKLRILNLAADMINSGTWQTVYTLSSTDRPQEQITSIAGGYGVQMSEVYVRNDGQIQINAIASGWLKTTAIWLVK